MKLNQLLVALAILTLSQSKSLASSGEQESLDLKETTTSLLKRIQGNWEGVAGREEYKDRIEITIKDDSFRFFRDEGFWFETKIVFPKNTTPQQFIATITSSAPSQKSSVGQKVPAIVKLEEGTLTIVAFQDNEADPPKTFDDQDTMLYVLQRPIAPGAEGPPANN